MREWHRLSSRLLRNHTYLVSLLTQSKFHLYLYRTFFSRVPDMHATELITALGLFLLASGAASPQLAARKASIDVTRKWNSFPGLPNNALAIRQDTCGVSEKFCGSGCIPIIGQCCDGIK